MTKLPHRRANVTRTALLAGKTRAYLTVGFHEDGTVGEVFLNVAPHDAGDTTQAWAGCWARAISLALRYGAPLDKVVEHFRYTTFEPQGLVQPGNPIRFARSLVDWAVAVLQEEANGAEAVAEEPP